MARTARAEAVQGPGAVLDRRRGAPEAAKGVRGLGFRSGDRARPPGFVRGLAVRHAAFGGGRGPRGACVDPRETRRRFLWIIGHRHCKK